MIRHLCFRPHLTPKVAGVDFRCINHIGKSAKNVLSSDGADHCLTWDSQEDFASDEQVLIRLACGVGSEEHDSVTSDPFAVENDPAPGEGDLLITELLPDSGLTSGEYLEIYNRANHLLDLQGMYIKRWKESDIGKVIPTSYFSIDDVTGTLTIDPGEHLLMAATYDEESNGCIDPDATWPSSFTMNDNSMIRFSWDGNPILEIDFTEDEGFEFDEGNARSLDPDRYDSDNWDRSSYWCEETTPIPSCDESSSTANGSPGEATSACE